jgi:DNA (cytosine-5)-methyltransferase 1
VIRVIDTEIASPSSGVAPKPRPRVVDLFAGGGGLSLGLLSAGFDIVAAVDNWDPAVRTYRSNFEHPVYHRDLATLGGDALCELVGCAPRELDLVVGGPPCQGFSVQRIGVDADERNDLILSYADHVNALQPRMFLMENVPGLLGKRGAPIARRFAASLERAGYEVRYERVNAAAYGVPQIRRRVIFYGWLRDRVPAFRLPAGDVSDEAYRSVWSAIGDLPSPPLDFTPPPTDSLHRRMRMSPLNSRRLSMIPPGGGFEHLPQALRVDCHRNGPDRIGHRNVYGRLHPEDPAATITARFDSFTRGKFAHPYEDRNITLREGARLQTFPDSHTLLGTQEQVAALIGNSVPPLLASKVAVAIRDHLTAQTAGNPRAFVPSERRRAA